MGETPHWLGGTRPPPRCYPGRVLDSWLVPPPRPNALGCSSPRGNTCWTPARTALCLFCAVRCRAVQWDAIRCGAMRCGVIGNRVGRFALLDGSWLSSGVEACLKQSGSCGLVTRMAAYLSRGPSLARSLPWASRRSVLWRKLVWLCPCRIVHPAAPGLEEHHGATSTRPGRIGKLLRTTLDSPPPD